MALKNVKEATKSMKKYIVFLLSFYGILASDSLYAVCDIDWLLGKWESKSAKRTYIESWSRVSEETLEGYSEVLDKDGRRSAYESLRLVKMSGEVFYVAKVKENEMPIPFKLIECSEGKLRFVNESHDFPKSIKYHSYEKAKMVVNVRGEDNKGFDLDFVRK